MSELTQTDETSAALQYSHKVQVAEQLPQFRWEFYSRDVKDDRNCLQKREQHHHRGHDLAHLVRIYVSEKRITCGAKSDQFTSQYLLCILTSSWPRIARTEYSIGNC